jgi:hypothetical protein
VVGPAIGNAIYAACGARVRHLPIRPEAVLQALREGEVHPYASLAPSAAGH